VTARKVLPATLEALEPYLQEFRARCQCLENRADRFAAELLLREVLTNAVVHGSHGDPHRQVRCAVHLDRWRLSIAVADDGEGFDWQHTGGLGGTELLCSGRGIRILRHYASRVRFNRKGNAVAILKRFGEANQPCVNRP